MDLELRAIERKMLVDSIKNFKHNFEPSEMSWMTIVKSIWLVFLDRRASLFRPFIS